MAAGGAYMWSNGANWVGGVAPGPADVANFPDLGVYSTITLSGLPASVQGIINISGRNVEIAAGSTLVITAAGSNINGVSFVDVSGTIEFTGTASTTGASGYRIQSGGTMRINGNPTIAGGLPVQYFAGSTLEYSGSGNRTTSQELPATMNGAVVINKTLSAETITLNAGTSIAGLTVTQGVFDAAGFTSTLSAASSVAAVNGTLTIGVSGFLTVAAGQTLTVNGTLNLNGTGNQLDLPGSTIVVGPSSTIAGAGLIKADANGIVRMQAATLVPANFTSTWIYNLIVDRATNVTYIGGLTVGNGGLQLANTGNLTLNCCGSLTVVDGIGVTQTSTGRIDIGGGGNSLIMQDDNLDGNHYVPGMNNLYINRAGGVNLTNTLDISILNYTSGALNINNTGNLIFTIPGGLTIPVGQVVNINNGGKVTVLPGKYFTNSGTVTVNAGGTFECQGDNTPGTRVSGTAIAYTAPTATLLYTLGTASVVWAAGTELPTPTMAGRVIVNKTALSSLTIASSTDIQGGLTVQTGSCSILSGSTTNISGGLTVQSTGGFDVYSGGSAALGAGSQIQNGGYMQAMNGSTVTGGANLTVQTGGILYIRFSPTATWTGTPTYQANSTLQYTETIRTTGAELPALMPGNVQVYGNTAAVTLGASTQINGTFTMTATPNNGTFTTAAQTLTLANATNTIGASATLTTAAGGTLIMGGNSISGAGNYTQNANGTLRLTNVNGVEDPAGAIRVTGTKTYNASAHYIFDDPGANGTTNFGSTVLGNMTVNFIAPNRLNLSGLTTINGTLTLNGGDLALNTQTLNIGAGGGFQVNSGARMMVTCSGAAMNLSSPAGSNSVNAGGVLWVGANALTLNQNVTIQNGARLIMVGTSGCGANGGIAGGAGNILYAGATATLQFIGNWNGTTTDKFLPPVMLGRVEVTSANVITVNNNKAIAGTLTLTTGRVFVGANAITLPNTSSVIGGSAASYIDCGGGGALAQTFPLGITAGAVLYPIGSGAGNYRPITLTNTTMSAGASVFGSVVSGAPPGGTNGIGFSGITSVTEYWSVLGANLTSAQMRPSQAPTALPGTARLGYAATVNGAYDNQTATINTPASGDFQSTAVLGAGYLAIGTGPSANSDIIETPGYTYSSSIAHSNAANREPSSPTTGSDVLWSMRLRDGGGAADADGLTTELNSLTLNLTTDSPSNPLYQVALFTPGGVQIGTVQNVAGTTATTVTFAGLSGADVTAADDGFIDIVLRGTFKQTSVIDTANVRFQVASVTANVTGSTFATANAGGAISINNTVTTGLPADLLKNRIDIVATQLSFPLAVGNQVVNTNFTPSVSVIAVDAFNNIDRTIVGTITLSGAPISVGGTAVIGAGSGTGVFSGLQVNGIGGYTFTATLGALTGLSAPFSVTTIPTYWGCTIPSVPPALPVLGIGGRDMNFNSVSLNGGGNVLTNVNPGAVINLTGNWSMNWPGGVYCPGCVVQMYVGIGGGSGFAGNGSSATGFTYCLGSGVYNGSSGAMAYAFNAPAKPGIYYISQAWTLHYYCNPHPVTFSNSTTNAIAVIQVVDPIPPSSCNEADIIPTPAFVYPTNINYSAYTAAMASGNPAVWGFQVRDYGIIPTQGDVDNKPTQVTSIGINVNDPNGVLQEIALYNGTGLIETQTVSGSGLVTFSSPAVAANIIAPDNGTFDVIVRARFRTTPLTPPMDNQNFSFSINQANVILAGAATSTQKVAFALVGPSSTAGNDNRVVVTASQLLYQAQPPTSTNAAITVAPSVVVQAVDMNNNVDVDYAGTITLANPNLLAGGSSVATAGVATFATLTLSGAAVTLSGQVLTATSAPVLTAAASNPFSIVQSVFHQMFSGVNANVLANWQLNGAGANPTALGVAGATYVVGATPGANPSLVNISAPLTIQPNSTFLVNGTAGGSTLSVLAGQTLTNNGTLSIQGGARLLLTDDGMIAPVSINPVLYAATNATLEYTGAGALNRTTNSQEFPSPLAARLTVSRTMGAFSLDLDASKTVVGEFTKNAAGTMVVGAGQTLTLQGGTYYSAGTLNLNGTGALIIPASGTFLITGGSLNLTGTGTATINGGFSSSGGAVNIGTSSLSLGGAINFGAGTVTPSAGFGTLDINGTGAISGALGGGVQYAQFTMNRANQILILSPGVNLRAANLSLLNGIIRTGAPADYVEVATTLTAVGSSTTHIDGKLRQTFPGVLNNAGVFDFPIGKGGVYLPIRFQNVTSNTAVIQAEAFNAGSGGAAGVGFSSVSTTEYWQTSLQSGAFTSAHVQLSRPTPVLLPAAVVGHSATQTGSYLGIGGSVSSPNVLSANPVTSADRFFALGVLSNVFYYYSGAAENVTSWNSDVLGAGSPATDFLTGGTTFIVPAGKTAPFSASQTFGAGVTTLVNGGGSLSIRNGSTLGVGIFRVAAGGTLVLVDSAKINAPSGVFYLGQTAQLLYDSPSLNRVATSHEFPATMLGSVMVSNGTVRLDTTTSVRTITIQGALTLQNSTLDFGKDSTRLRLEGAISFNPSQFKTNLTHGLTIAGSGSITGTINFSDTQIGWLSMQRSGVTLPLGDSLTVGSQLSLLGGNVSLPSARHLLIANSADSSLAGGSFSSYVHGILARSLPSNLTPTDARSHFYPLGKGATYLPLTLLNATTGSVSPIVAAEAFTVGAGGSVALGANGALSPSEHWRVQTLSGNFAGSSVGVLRPSGFVAADRLGASATKAGVYSIVGGALTPIGQGTSLVGDPVQNAGERFYSAVGPTLGAPRITGFSPGRGGEQTTILVTGTNLTGINAVAIGGIGVSSFSVLSSTTMIVTVGAVATGPIQIGSPIGGAASDSNFVFVPSPRIFNAMPSPAGLGVPITINGENFLGASYLNIGGVDIPGSLFSVAMSGNAITTSVPLGATNATILINAPGGTAISTNALVLIPPPVIASINPQVASTGETVVLLGANFVGVQSLRFGTTSAQYTVNSPNRITLVVPPRLTVGPTQVYITVQTGSGTATTATRFAYNPLPGGLPNGVDPLRLVVVSEARDKITVVGGNIRVTGANMELIQEIKLITAAGSTNASWLLSSSAALTLIVPTTGLLRGTSGTVLSSAATTMDVLGAFNRVVLSNAFTVVGVPQIVSNTPTDGNIGDEVMVTGTRMNLINAMRIGGTAATFRIVDSTRVAVIIPARVSADGTRLPASGVLGFTSFGGITGTGGTIVNSALSSGLPVITSFSPTSGPPGTEVVVQGANLTAVRDVSVVGITVASFVVNSSTRMTLVLSTQASTRSQGPITLQTSFGTLIDSRDLYRFPYSLEADQNAAAMLVSSLGGDPSKLEVTTVNNRITVLRLRGAGLQGSVPAYISTLTELRELDLSNNLLSGAVPISLSALKKLERLNLSNNLFSGALTPGLFCSYENMRYLDVSRNNLTGEIPVCIATLDKIETLNLMYNRFTSLLPWQLGAMTSLVELRVSNNQLSGELPPELGTGGERVTKTTASKTTARTTAVRVPTVQVIDVSNNQFTGGIPEEWGNIPQLRELNVMNCNLTGSLPATMKNWQGIQSMRLSNNRLSGVIPPFNVGSLREFIIDNNRFSGALPESFGQVAGLRVLSARNNRLTFIPNPSNARLDTVRLDSNRLEFGSLEPFGRVKVFQADGQDSVKASDDVSATLGDVVEIPSNIGGTSTRYQWYNNGAMVRGATGATLRIGSVLPQDVGMYVCRATNTVVRNVTLYTQAVRVSVTSAAQAIGAPELLFPTNSASNIAPRPAFRWSRVVAADSYTIVVARDRSLRSDAQSVTVSSSETGDSVVLAWASAGAAGRGVLLERGVRYYWSVRAASGSELLVPSWSDTLSFSVVPFGQDLAFSSVDLGRTTIGDSARATGSIVNIGDDAVLVQSAQVESGLANVFALNFTQKLLPKDGSASFDVLFKPDRPDTIRANVTVRYADAQGQGSRSVSIEKALVGRGGALAIDPLDFDSVRIGKASIQSVRITNRSDRKVVINGARVLIPRGGGVGSEEENVFAIVSGTSMTMNAGDVAFIAVRCSTVTRGVKRAILEVLADNDVVQSDITAVGRLVRSDDPAVSFRMQASPDAAAPGSSVRLDVVINDFTQALAQTLLQAAQPEVRLTVRFDKQVLALDNADGSARMQQSESDTGVVVLNVRWDGRSRAVASLPARAVAGRRTVTNLEIINAAWGSTSATAAPEWERRVFVEEPAIPTPATFTAKVSQAGGKRLISSSSSSSAAPLLSLARPNPASDVVSLTYTLFEEALVTVEVLNMRGEVVQTLLDETSRTSGEYTLSANVRTLPTGAYLLRLRANGRQTATQRFEVGR